MKNVKHNDDLVVFKAQDTSAHWSTVVVFSCAL